MTRFQAFILCAITILLTVLAMLLASLGYDWQTKGFGLNPMLAYPMAILCLAAIVAFWVWWLHDTADDLIRRHFGITGEYEIDYISLSQR